MNKVTLIGRVGRDAEVKEIGGNVNVSFSLATSERYTKDGEQTEQTEWHSVTAWGERWRKLAQWITKGRQLAVEGRIHYRESMAQDGTKRYYTDIVAQNIEFVGDRQQAAPQTNNTTSYGTADPMGDLPF